jgi:Arc/MetJ-type ribon-helix-helix transcriptional regulator
MLSRETKDIIIMTIHLPENLESSVLEAVHRGQFASIDDAMTQAARLLLQQCQDAQTAPDGSEKEPQPPAEAVKPIWEEIEELAAGIPDEEFLRLPGDGAEQLDHYIYGLPKRPPS